jgi:uncharacterized HAD superfamily protein
MLLPELELRNDIYYVTNRAGASAKRQTESWLYRYLPYAELGVHPTVLITSDKGAAAKALKLDVYVDDNLDNIKGVLRESATTRAYLFDRAYNQGEVSIDVPAAVQIGPNVRGVLFGTQKLTGTRVKTLGELFDAEIANL